MSSSTPTTVTTLTYREREKNTRARYATRDFPLLGLKPSSLATDSHRLLYYPNVLFWQFGGGL
jgi:hypothetical protein